MSEEKSLYDLGDQQRRIVETVWAGGGATVRQVWEAVSPNRSLAYTSILSAMQKLESCGWLEHQRQGRHYVYKVAMTREQAQQAALAKFIGRVYDGAPSLLLFQILRDKASRSATPTLRTLVDMKRAVAPDSHPFKSH